MCVRAVRLHYATYFLYLDLSVICKFSAHSIVVGCWCCHLLLYTRNTKRKRKRDDKTNKFYKCFEITDQFNGCCRRIYIIDITNVVFEFSSFSSWKYKINFHRWIHIVFESHREKRGEELMYHPLVCNQYHVHRIWIVTSWKNTLTDAFLHEWLFQGFYPLLIHCEVYYI